MNQINSSFSTKGAKVPNSTPNKLSGKLFKISFSNIILIWCNKSICAGGSVATATGQVAGMAPDEDRLTHNIPRSSVLRWWVQLTTQYWYPRWKYITKLSTKSKLSKVIYRLDEGNFFAKKKVGGEINEVKRALRVLQSSDGIKDSPTRSPSLLSLW